MTTKLDRLERSRVFLHLFQDVAGLGKLTLAALLAWWGFGTIYAILSNNEGVPVVVKGLLRDGLKTFFSVFQVLP